MRRVLRAAAVAERTQACPDRTARRSAADGAGNVVLSAVGAAVVAVAVVEGGLYRCCGDWEGEKK